MVPKPIELTISRASKQENKDYYNFLFQKKAAIEIDFGSSLIWDELPNNKMSRIKVQLDNVNIYEENDWIKMNNFIIIQRWWKKLYYKNQEKKKVQEYIKPIRLNRFDRPTGFILNKQHVTNLYDLNISKIQKLGVAQNLTNP